MKILTITILVLGGLSALYLLLPESRKQFIKNLAAQIGDVIPRYFV